MVDLTTVETRDLQAELTRREGVKVYELGVEDSAEINVKCSSGGLRTNTIVELTGPAIITVNVD